MRHETTILAQLVADCDRLVKRVELVIKMDNENLKPLLDVPKYIVAHTLRDARKQGF